MLGSYILIDTTLLGESREKLWVKKERHPTWIVPIYGRSAMEVSPIVIDIQQAIQASKTSIIMDMVNARRPQLGVSFIESNFSLSKIVRHLRNFVYVRTSAEKELTLRFADCLVLPALAAVFDQEQWAAFTEPFKSWKIHDRDGRLVSLPLGKGKVANIPLLLLDEQIANLRELMAANQLLFNIRMQRPAEKNFYLTSIAYEYAVASRSFWHAAGNIDDLDLVLFASHVFDTNGALLSSKDLLSILDKKNRTEMDANLKKLTNSSK